MKAVMVGTVGDSKLYLVVDAKSNEKNGALVRGDDSTVMVDIVSFSSKVRNLTKIRTSRFHRFFWDAPKNTTSGSWYETFVARTKPIDGKILDGVRTVSSLGKPSKKLSTIDSKAKRFSASNQKRKMVKSKGIEMSESQVKMAWAAIQMLNEAGELE